MFGKRNSQTPCLFDTSETPGHPATRAGPPIYLTPAAYRGDADPVAGSTEAPAGLLVVSVVLALANVYFGLDTRLPVEAAGGAAASLVLGGHP